MPSEEKRNQHKIKDRLLDPANKELAAGGCDPYDHGATTDGKRSDAALYVKRKFDPMQPYFSSGWACEYIARPKTPFLMYEDIMMTAVFYGIQILVENNRPGCVNSFIKYGLQNYLLKRPLETMKQKYKGDWTDFGIPMSGDAAREALIEGLENEVYDNIGMLSEDRLKALGVVDDQTLYGVCPFDRLLNDWAIFDPNKWTKHDPTVASGLALLAAKPRKINKRETLRSVKMFQKYKYVGNKAVKI
jgi:hypothetical protein